MAQVFISYSHKDQTRAEAVAQYLESAGIDVWWDSELRRGRFANQIEAVLKKASCVVVLWSNSTITSDWVPAEADY